MRKLIMTMAAIAGLLTIIAAGTGFAQESEYRNVIDQERFEAALSDQGNWGTYKNMINREYFLLALADQQTEGSQYKNVINLDRFELALVDQREIDGWYKNVVDRDTFLANLGDPCLTEEGGITTTLLAYCVVR